ncbi:ABC transporter permease [Bifidobacterium psychraerophilum]|uniref:ABC transporter permease n=1 Tax=Bifidobacterium psychraerophilum TaxID=218140 RepID=UPI0039E79C17
MFKTLTKKDAVMAPTRFTRKSWFMRMPVSSRVSLVLLALFVLLAVCAPILPLDAYTGVLSQRMKAIASPGHLLGTDNQGRDLLARLVFGMRTSLVISVTPVIVATLIALVIGIASGFGGTIIHAVCSKVIELLFAFPGILLSLLVAISLGNGMMSLILALTVVWIAPLSKVAEQEAMRIKERDYMLVARASGAKTLPIIMSQVLPVIFPAVLAYATSLVGASIAIAGGLGFIGLGVPSPTAELGAMLQELQPAIFTNPMLVLEPGILIIVLAILFPVVGDGLNLAIGGRKS